MAAIWHRNGICVTMVKLWPPLVSKYVDAKHVLIVEDNPHLRRILAGSLEHHGYTISEATTGREAIVKAINAKPKLILWI